MATSKPKREPWVMPAWMEPYREQFCETGGNSIEDLMNDRDSNMFSNSIRAALCIACIAQVGLLTQLHTAGKI